MKLRQPKTKRSISLTKLFFPFFILLIMVLSVFGVVFFGVPKSETFKYKEHTFVQGTDQYTGGYSVTINNQKFVFLYDPRELENLEIPELTLTQLQYANKFYLSTNPNHDTGIALNEFNRLLLPLLGKRTTLTCSEDVEGCEELLIKTCEDAAPEAKVIVYEESETPKVTYELNCLKIQGNGEEMAKLTDKLALNFLIP